MYRARARRPGREAAAESWAGQGDDPLLGRSLESGHTAERRRSTEVAKWCGRREKGRGR